MADVFISYTRDEIDIARRFAQAVELQGLSVWWDQAIRSGDSYDEVTEGALREARAVIVLWSRKSVASRWVRSEATIAQRLGTLVPVMIEPCERPVMFELVQTADLSDWTGHPDHPGFRAFAQDIRCLVTGDCERMSPVDLATGAPLILPSKPSIAVMPFTEMGRGEDDHFADGLAEELSVSLSRFSSLFVIAGQSSGSYRGTAKPASQIARELGVRFLLEGSVRRAGNRVRVAVKLVDALANEQVWAERFDDELVDIFELQDRIAMSVASSIDSTITDVEFVRVTARATKSPTAYDLATHAHARINRYMKESVTEGQALALRAIEADPGYAWAHAMLAVANGILFLNQWSADRQAAREVALRHGRQAIALGADDELVLAFVAGMMMNVGADIEEAARLADRAMELNPNKGLVLFWAGWTDVERGNAERGLDRFERSLRLNPRARTRPFQLTGMGNCLYFLGRYREAAVVQEEALRLLPDYPPANLIRAAALHLIGDQECGPEAVRRVEAIGGIDKALFYFTNRAQRKELRAVWSEIEGAACRAA